MPKPKKSPGIRGQEALLKRQTQEVKSMVEDGSHIHRPMQYKTAQERASRTATRLRSMRRAANR